MNEAFVSYAWASTGTYEVVLEAWNGDHPSGVAATAIVSVVESVCYVNVSNAAPAHPYASGSTAATTIQDAVSAGEAAGRLVLVTNGLYATGSRVMYGAMRNRAVLTNAVTVKSVNGPDMTIIRGYKPGIGDAVRCVYVGAQCVLAGFTLTNGATLNSGDWDKEQSGGGVWCETGGMVSNCVIAGNAATRYGGGSYDGTFLGCLFSGNSSGRNGGGACYGTLHNCVLRGNATVEHGGGAYYGALYNCLLTANTAGEDGGGAYAAFLHNSTIVGCTASQFGGGTRAGELYNSIVFYNTARGGPHWYNDTFSDSCTTLAAAGERNTTLAPAFVSTNGWGNLRLAAGSPCINGGDNAHTVGATDLDGLPRIIGGVADMGAYESTNGVTSTGVPWGWLLGYGLATDGSADLLDQDKDGLRTHGEYAADTDPSDASSLLAITALSNRPPVRLYFPSSRRRLYTLQISPDLPANAWVDIAGQAGIRGTGGITWLQDARPPSNGVYRIRAAVP